MSYGNCPKKYRTIASFTTNRTVPGHESWDLTPYKKSGMGKPGGTWRLIEVGCDNEKRRGIISADGTLAPDPAHPAEVLYDQFTGSASYDGYMELQIADPEPTCDGYPCPENEKEEEYKCQP